MGVGVGVGGGGGVIIIFGRNGFWLVGSVEDQD